MLYGGIGREGGIVIKAINELIGDRVVAKELTELALRDPKVARDIFQYKGKDPEKFRKYIRRNPTVAGILSAAQPENED